ncbi:MAG: EAL domain-containing protein [Candidatus Magnetoovum sp. WYHC-5]|nr:EAL domain-containing protein [Candidatus Magnetoovum sp. WYHC-5]
MKEQDSCYQKYYIKQLTILFASIFLLEFLVMIYIYDYIRSFPPVLGSLIGATILMLTIIPIVYVSIIKPTAKEIATRIKAEKKNQYNTEIQSVISSLIQLSLTPVSLKKQLEKAMDLLLTVSWFAPEKAGSIYLTDTNKPDRLIRIVEKNLPAKAAQQCTEVEFGQCLCGLAALEKNVVFTDCINQDHPIAYDGMKAHGHYCVPIKIHEAVLGVLNLYVEEGHVRSDVETAFLSSFADTLATIIQKNMKEKEILYISNYDKLTGLSNRGLFINRINHDIYYSIRHNKKLALLYIDIDNFRKINDVAGYDEADNILKVIANRIANSLRRTDTVARISSDEFAVIVTALDNVKYIEIVAKKLLAIINRPYNTYNRTMNIEASIGISIYPEHGVHAETLLNKASVSVRHAKKKGGNCYVLFSADISQKYDEQIDMELALMDAIRNNKLMIYYQSQIEIRTGKIVGAEALLRWQHEGNMVSPAKFIPIAEQTGLIVPIGEWVIKEVCKQNKEWQRQGLPAITVAVNISSEQLNKAGALIEQVKKALSDSGLAPHFLDLELTESMCMKNLELTKSIFAEFQKLGIQLSIDDFGTGYSSLNYIKNLPFNKLKIDRSFIQTIVHDKYDQTIVEAVIKICKVLNLKTIAEGVETHDQLEVLRQLKCNEVQGFLFSKPVPADSLTELLKDEFQNTLNYMKSTYVKRILQTETLLDT